MRGGRANGVTEGDERSKIKDHGSIPADMDISPTNFPVMRLLGTKDAVDFVSLVDL